MGISAGAIEFCVPSMAAATNAISHEADIAKVQNGLDALQRLVQVPKNIREADGLTCNFEVATMSGAVGRSDFRWFSAA